MKSPVTSGNPVAPQLQRPSLAIIAAEELVCFLEVGDLQVLRIPFQPQTGQFLADFQAQSYVAQQDSFGERPAQSKLDPPGLPPLQASIHSL